MEGGATVARTARSPTRSCLRSRRNGLPESEPGTLTDGHLEKISPLSPGVFNSKYDALMTHPSGLTDSSATV